MEFSHRRVENCKLGRPKSFRLTNFGFLEFFLQNVVENEVRCVRGGPMPKVPLWHCNYYFLARKVRVVAQRLKGHVRRLKITA